MSDVELDNDLELPPVPPVERYKQAFHAIEAEMSDNQLHLLRTQYYAPNHAITMRELAKVVGYRSFRGANLQYGRLGRLLRDVLNYREAGQLSYVLSYFVSPGTEDNEEWLLVMHPEVAQALEELGWV